MVIGRWSMNYLLVLLGMLNMGVQVEFLCIKSFGW
jgi:hypothetical protein